MLLPFFYLVMPKCDSPCVFYTFGGVMPCLVSFFDKRLSVIEVQTIVTVAAMYGIIRGVSYCRGNEPQIAAL